MQPAAIFVHGFNDLDAGRDNIDRLAPFVVERGYKPLTQALDYGWRGLFGVRWRNHDTALKLMDMYRPGDVIIGYSNGCEIIAEAVNMGLACHHIIMVHPALDAHWCPPRYSQCRRIDVYYSPRDTACQAAGWLQKLSPLNWLFGKHPWGNMGAIGPQAPHAAFFAVDDNCDHFEWVKQPRRYVETLEDAR